MVELSKDTGFSGVEDYFPDELRPAVLELVRRLERLNSSLIYQLRSQPTVFSKADDDPPEGPVLGDVWVHNDGTVQVYDSLAWVP